MAPSPLHGLNIVHTDTGADQYADNTQDSLLDNAHFPDLAAQLDLWSNLTFQTDEPAPVRRSSRKFSLAEDEQTGGEDDKDDDAAEVEGPASLEAHVNAVNPTAVSNTPHPQFDMTGFLQGFPIDPFLLSQVPAPQPPPPAATLAQLLAAYPFANAPFLPHGQTPAVVAPAALSSQPPERSVSDAPTQTKRSARTRKMSIATSVASPSPSAADFGEGESEQGTGNGQGLSAAEDKRRRNTAASARFRLKKKEREAALERRAHELETRVSALERECEGLRRENGWLKGLVVGVTGASQGAQVVSGSGATSSPVSGPNQGKRKRVIEEGKEETKKLAIAA